MSELIMIAGDRFPGFPWQPSHPEHGPTDIGARRTSHRAEAFCLRHASILEIQTRPAAMVFGYKLSPAGDTAKLAGLHQSLRHMASLEGRLPASFYINTLAVYPHHQGRGCGVLLLEAAEKRARRANCSCLLLEVDQDNEAAIRFYSRNGFAHWPAPVRYTSPDGTLSHNIFVLEKDLTPDGG